jgi:hypothetical protein
MKAMKPTTRRRCLLCILAGLAAGLAASAALTARRGPEAVPLPGILVQTPDDTSRAGVLPEVVVRASRPDGLLDEVLVRATGTSPVAAAPRAAGDIN